MYKLLKYTPRYDLLSKMSCLSDKIYEIYKISDPKMKLSRTETSFPVQVT